MKVAFGTTVLANCLAHGGVDGIGTYTRELGGELSRGGGITLVPAGFRATVPAGFFNDEVAPLDLGAYVPAAGASATAGVPFSSERVLAGRVDLYHATDHLIPKFSRIPVVATLMDAIPLSHPEWTRRKLAPLKRWLWRRSGHWADHVITISEYSKREIIRHFDIAPEKISVTPLGVDERYFTRMEAASVAEVLLRLGLQRRFFMFLGTLQPRKNLGRVLDAHAALRPEMQEEFPLVVVGRAGWESEALIARLKNPRLGRTVRWLERQPDHDVRCLMQAALALVFPSLGEGFGLPMVEAFAAGLPVIASNTTSLPEVAGGAALLVNPEDSGEICDAMRMLIEDSLLAEKLVAGGLRRARELSWKACAQATQAAYSRVLSG